MKRNGQYQKRVMDPYSKITTQFEYPGSHNVSKVNLNSSIGGTETE